MITIDNKNNLLVISIPCGSSSPMEKLTEIQTGLLNLVKNADFRDSPKNELQHSINTAINLLNETSLSEKQAQVITHAVSENTALENAFNSCA